MIAAADWQRLYAARAEALEDFWGRRAFQPRHRRDFRVFGRAASMTSNEATALAALDYSLPLFSTAPESDHPPFVIEIVARPLPLPAGESVAQVVDHVQFTGQGQWIAIHLGPWGQVFADLAAGRAAAIIAPELAARPDLLSLTVLNTVLLNFCLAAGFGMLHASCLWRDDRALLLMAPHNMGKSTTALRLVLAGFALVSDSMVHVVPEADRDSDPLLVGFPVSRIKLRADMLDAFASLRAFVRPERVRDEVKYVLDLARIDPATVRTDGIRVARATLCLLAKGQGEGTSWRPATRHEVAEAVLANSLFLDSPQVWQRNLAAIDRLLARAQCYHLAIGRDPDRLVAAVAALWSDGAGQGAG